MGSRGVLADQDAGTMVAKAGTTDPGTNGISRSMTRYRSTRRHAKPSYEVSPPKLPTGQDMVAQDLPTLNFGDSSEDAKPRQPDFPKQADSRPRRRAGSNPKMRSRPDHPLQDTQKDWREEADDATDMPSLEPRGHGQSMQDTADPNRAHALQNEFRAVEDGRDRPRTQSKSNRPTTIYNGERLEERIPRPTYSPSAKSQNAVPQSSRPITLRQTTSEKFGSFSRRIEKQVPRPQAFEKSNNRAELKRMISGPIPIEPQVPQGFSAREFEEPVVAPRSDVPISAVNAGSRMVRVKYEDTEVSVAITPSTTPVDIVRSTARQISAPIDERSNVLLESFKQVGLERPLRKYEHIRDVLNSWDYDAQNTLVIVTSPTGGKDDDLDVKNVSKLQPGDTTVYLYHSQKPGRWDKRWITLRFDGQILVSKKHGGETANICHLSDFDIYIPTPRYSSKKIKPPKQVCFAVKSLQKSSMFISTANFVHFFSTSDRQLATSWYKAVQEWRSWYLVNVMGKGQNAKEASKDIATNGMRQGVVNAASTAQHRLQLSPEMKPRIQNAQPTASPLPIRSPTTKAGPSSYPKKLTKDPLATHPATRNPGPTFIQQPSAQTSSPDPFEPASLLGRTYTQRQKAQQRSPPDELPPPLPLSTLAQPATSSASPSTTQKDTFSTAATVGASATTNIKRTSSTRRPQHPQLQMPKPLIDLTPQYQPPPQHTRKGRGVKPEQIPAGGLIEVATSPVVAIQIPPSREWRRPGTSGGGGGA